MTRSNRRSMRALAVTTGAALAAASLTLLPSAAQAADPVVLNLLAINDFHGRIDTSTTKFATTVEQQRALGGEANTLFLSAGDNVGASLFASASLNDNPTIDVLNALDLTATAVGNHELDKGFSDLTGHIADRADYDILGANIYDKGTTTPALDEYKVYPVVGIRVGVIGVVTDETPSLVSPGGITQIDVGDPVAAINRVADQLTDGSDANGEADVLVAALHEGAAGTTAQALADEAAGAGAFADIVNDTTAKVDAIITGHTHKEYVWDAPVPGAPGGCTTGTPGCTRPMVQTGEYGNNVGRITLSVDPDTKAISAYTVGTVDRASAEDPVTYPRVQAVKDIVTAALAASNEVGKQPVGGITRNITTAYATGSFVDGVWTQPDPNDPKIGRDDRGSESTLGDTVAEALRSSVGGADIGIVNPGGLRDELFYEGVEGSETNHDGVVTFAEANAVLPFVNNVWTVDLTGAQLKQVLEQQDQPDGAQRPFLQLGVSENVKVVYDDTLPEGDRVASVLIDGQPLSLAKTYTVSTFSFLATGGDNFAAFTQGTGSDTGLVDRDVWIQHLGEHNPLSPDFARRQVYATGVPATVDAGQPVNVTLKKLNLTSLGTPETTSLTAWLRPSGNGDAIPVGTYAVTGGNATVAFTAPDDLDGTYTLTLVSDKTGVIVGKRLAPFATTTTGTVLDGGQVVAGSGKARVLVDVTPADDGAAVDAFWNGTKVGTGAIVSNAVTLTLAPFTKAGPQEVTLRYAGGATTKPSGSTVTVTVLKATPKVRVTVRPDTIRRSTKPRLTIKVTAPGLSLNGYATVRSGGKLLALVKITAGKGRVTLPAFKTTGKKKVTVRFLGNAVAKAASKTFTIMVVK